ncbi:hypothetical protein DICPUDRAFT_44248 [Dictyostelium purpureum]|uniref:D-isomer specific 2-hydroxyacid dehydrogenase NAD-binding domain-containing protein n=1 Tax=Dictyostelium purpureum TaxID=5786 RepID=F1A5T1_DICPU|nr:uncharacterized protein DICPUDRAFT_44248 [Dictyostelium purpureum]EGC28448.1 hypothetical protein DICPUDRAFT_44248 [Dictyostelium purpureum]|eukprot:XP_003295025.1 hypothetical protein DICPUDRAFT_44248 [Dictyostelium purpureum]
MIIKFKNEENNINHNKKKIVIYKNISQQLLNKLLNHFKVICFNQITKDNMNLFIDEIETADGLMGRGLQIGAKILNKANNLKVISAMSSGIDQYDLNILNHRKIPLMYTPNVSNDSVADLAIGLMLNCSRKIKNSMKRIKNGEWEKKMDYNFWYGLDVHHKKIGIVGMGRIGLTLSKRARFGFDMEVLYHSRTRHFDAESLYDAVFYQDVDELLKECDFVVSILPLTEETRFFFSESKFSLMKNTAIFVNVGRGGVVDEVSLIKALKDGRIAGAGLDVFEFEPLSPTSPLLSLDNLVCTPHLGIATLETSNKIDECAVNNLINVLINGNLENNCYNFDSLFK